MKWLDGSGVVIGTTPTPITTTPYTAPTNGWEQVVASLVPPLGTTNADVRMVATSLNATIYVDDFLFTATVPGPPTVSAFTPDNGLGKTVVTITGSDFTGALAVAFNGVAATAFT